MAADAFAADVFSFDDSDGDEDVLHTLDVPVLPRRRVRDVIVDEYLQSRLGAGGPARGASLCPRLLGTDACAWERWIARFASHPTEGAASPRALRPDRTPSARRRRVRARAERVPPRPTRPRAFSRHGQGVGARYVLGAVDGIGGAAEDGGRRGHADAAGGAGGAVPGGRPTRSSASSAPGARAPVRPRLRSEARVAADVRRRRRGYANAATTTPRRTHTPTRSRGWRGWIRVDSRRCSWMRVSAKAGGVPAEVTVRALTEAVRAADVRGTRECLHLYLRELFARDPDAGERWHRAQVSLYAEFHPEELLNFLERANWVRSRRRSGRVRAPRVAQGAGVPAVEGR